MRDIKFRVWDKKNKKMIFWDSIHNIYTRYDNKNSIGVEYDSIDKMCIERTVDIELMQFTGLKDKNGKEIYEGDILATNSMGEPSVDEWSQKDFGYTVCFWEAPSFKFSLWSPDDTEDSIFNRRYVEIIGNIYENDNRTRNYKDIK